MKRMVVLIAFLALVAPGLTGCRPSRVAVAVSPPAGALFIADYNLFYTELAPYGTWREYGSYGWVWSPNQVNDPLWGPYVRGYWVWTNYGWTWISLDSWGWATCHYGGWMFVDGQGWLWRPGRIWGPAWVSWRRGNGWVGWAPLPPDNEWSAGRGFAHRDFDRGIRPHSYTFVEEKHLLDRNLRSVAATPARNITLVTRTQNITDYAETGGRIVNRGIDPNEYERTNRRKVKSFDLADSKVQGPTKGRVKGREVIVYRPRIEDRPGLRPPQPLPARTDGADRPPKDKQDRGVAPKDEPSGPNPVNPRKPPAFGSSGAALFE